MVEIQGRNKLYVLNLCRIFWQMEETYRRILIFHMDDTQPPNWNDIEPSDQLLKNKGVPVHNMKYFDQVN